MTDDSRRIDRRRVLASLAAAGTGGLAGCPSVTINIGDDGGDGSGDGGGDGGVLDGDGGDGGGDDGGDGGGSDGGGASGDLTCTDINSGYDRQDVGARPVLFDFDRPAMFDELLYNRTGQVTVFEAQQDRGELSMQVGQMTSPGESEDTSGFPVFETGTLNGEEVDFWVDSSPELFHLVWYTPYGGSGERQVYTSFMQLDYFGEPSNECGDALRTFGRHFIDTLEFNQENTLDATGGGG